MTGATVMMPSPSEANQLYQVVSGGATDPCRKMKPAVPPSPDTAVPTMVATSRPSTRRTLPRSKTGPKKRPMSHATSTASPALQTAKTMALHMLRSPSMLATTVAPIAPAMTGSRAPAPRLISTPAEMPAAGQNTATPSGSVSR